MARAVNRTGPAAGRRSTSGSGRWAMLAVLCSSLLLVAMDATILNVALPALIDDLQPSAVQQLWIIDIYGLVLGGLLVTTGALSDRLGRRKLFLIGFVLFGVASVLAATVEQLDAAHRRARAARRRRGDGHAVHALADPEHLHRRPRAGPRHRDLGRRQPARAPRSDRSSAGCWSSGTAGPPPSGSTSPWSS